MASVSTTLARKPTIPNGNLNVLCVTGVVRLDPNADVGGDDATPVTLDWPSEATRAAAKRARKKLLKGPANYPGPWND